VAELQAGGIWLASAEIFTALDNLPVNLRKADFELLSNSFITAVTGVRSPRRTGS
jgi:hypothetical protein